MAGITDSLQSLFDRAGGMIPGVGSDYYQKLAYTESRYNPSAQASSSSAGGLFQFIDKTWSSYGGGGNRFDPNDATNAVVNLTRDNYSALSKALGRAPSQGELYLAHQQGAGGAISLLRNPNADASDIVGTNAVLNNGGTPGMTAGAFASLWTGKFDKGGGAAQSPLSALGSMLSPMTYLNAATGQAPAAGDTMGGVVANQAAATQAGWIDFIKDGAIRAVVIILGFIFVAVGLAMFKPGVVISMVPAGRLANVAKAVAK